MVCFFFIIINLLVVNIWKWWARRFSKIKQQLLSKISYNVSIKQLQGAYVTIFGKIDQLRASTEIHFLLVLESSFMHYPVLDQRWPCKSAFTDSFLLVLLNHENAFLIAIALRGINRTTRGTKLLLTAVMAHMHAVDFISLCQILKAQHCQWCIYTRAYQGLCPG